MKQSLLPLELRKLLRLPVLWICCGLCLGFNLLLIFSNEFRRDLFNDASSVAVLLGQRVDETFMTGLPYPDSGENGKALYEAAAELDDWTESYDTAGLFASYAAEFRDSPLAFRWLERKYEAAARRVEALRTSGGAMDFYAGPATHDNHLFLFGTLLRAVTTEGAVLGMLSALYLLGCEDITRTAGLLSASRAGRRQWRVKGAAGVLGTLLLWLLLAGLSLGTYFSRWDYSGVWTANVSSGFNYVEEFLIAKPFLTWADFTVAGYLAASLALSAGLSLVCCLIAAVAGFCIRGVYFAALAPVLLGSGGLLLAVRLGELRGAGTAFALSCFQPVILWLDESIWFTESGTRTVLPWQEPVTLALWLLLAGLALRAAWKHFLRKDV